MSVVSDVNSWLDHLVDSWDTDYGSASEELRDHEAELVGAEPGDRFVRLATGGWSFNEELISRAQDDHQFAWMMTWQVSARGGLFIFKRVKEGER